MALSNETIKCFETLIKHGKDAPKIAQMLGNRCDECIVKAFGEAERYKKELSAQTYEIINRISRKNSNQSANGL